MTSVNPLFDLSGKVAIVTGSTRGIGWACVCELARAGASVTVSSEDAHESRERAAALAEQGHAAMGVGCDVRDGRQLEVLVEATLARYGRLDIVVANAGVTLAEGPLAEVPEAAWRTMMDINLHAAVRLANLAAPCIARAGGGSLIFMSYLSALRGNRRLGVYSLTKAALAQLARNLAVEWGGAKIRANAIAPGLIDTAFAAPLKQDAAAFARRLARTPLGRMGDPAEVAGTVVYFASPAGAFVTGQTIVVDGGALIGD